MTADSQNICHPTKEIGASCPICNRTDPINSATGNSMQVAVDYRGPGPNPLTFIRYYNSDNNVADGHIGAHWRTNYDRSLRYDATVSQVTVYRPDGKQYLFTGSSGAWSPDVDVTDKLTETSDGSAWYYTTAGNVGELYGSTGILQQIMPPGSPLATNLNYDANGNLIEVIKGAAVSSEHLTFTYDSNGNIATMTDPDGGVTTYGYTNGNLTSVTHPDNTVEQYLYNESAQTGGTDLPHALTGLIDENGNRYATWTYDRDGWATSSQVTGLAPVTVAYNSDGTTTITDGLGTPRTYGFSDMFGAHEVTSETQPTGSGTGTATLSRVYDANGYLASFTDWNGNTTTYVRDSKGREKSRTEAYGTPQARTITTDWWVRPCNSDPVCESSAPDYLPAIITGPMKTTTFTYEGPYLGTFLHSRTDQIPTATRTTTYTYDPNRYWLTSVDGPRTDVADITTYTYYANTADDGKLATITDALGHVTTINTYDADGNPSSFTDPNGLVTTLHYDTRGRLKSRDADGELIQFGYDNVGDLKTVTLPDSTTVTYNYDLSHHLTGITDAAGNTVTYTLDAAGNRTAEQIKDTGGTLTRAQTWVYNALSRLTQSIGANNQTTQYGYDANGNLKSVTDPNSYTTQSSFDALNRLVQQTGPLGGITTYGYDSQDHLISVTDADGHTTSYDYDGLGDLLSQTSPDTGTTTYTPDSAGNVHTRTDALGQVTTYSYDALNRLTQASYADGSVITYTYDTAPNGIGRLAQVTDPSGTTSWEYDLHGRITARHQHITANGVSTDLTTGYRYDTFGRLTRVTYPSGHYVDYSYTNGKVSALTLDSQPCSVKSPTSPSDR